MRVSGFLGAGLTAAAVRIHERRPSGQGQKCPSRPRGEESIQRAAVAGRVRVDAGHVIGAGDGGGDRALPPESSVAL